MSIPATPVLSPLYYLDNFRTVLVWISARYSDLLNADELQFIAEFDSLSTPAQALLVRMIMRKGLHFRASKLSYSEIGPIDEAAEPLCALGWLRTDVEIDLEVLFSLMRKDELLAQLPAAAKLRTCTKGGMLETLSLGDNGDADCRQKPFSLWCPSSREILYSLTINTLCDRLRLIFFGNLNQTWAEFVLADLGIFRYETIDIAPESRGFRFRKDIDDFLHLHACREAFEAGMPIEEIEQTIGDFSNSNPYLQERHGKLLFKMARQLEREAALAPALILYRRSDYAGSRQRRIRILEKLARYDQAHALATTAMANPESESERQLVERSLVRLSRKLGQPRRHVQPTCKGARMDLVLSRPGHGSVERAVSEQLATPSAPVYYVENALISSLFGLLCWEAIFAPLPGAFFHPFHSAPVDLHSTDFYRRRADLFQGCLAHLHTGTYPQVIRGNYIAKHGIQSPFVYWGLSQEVLDQALLCLPPTHLQHWFERLLLDIRANRTGMPDLIQFWPQEKRYRMIEVKGPGDRLQDNQRRWIAFCEQHGMPVDVCHVTWAEA
ncbi:VRR-NUC domain-containing protein [uncultured Halopseudomonas sp.]|uniref:VRR-NUC domain-containing protein n=1 Tax=uncultured Halopseudomonas sp. TaxID=2901193 RepID=UPI0030EEFE46|tara:strand:+ start:7516 stop:9177 length:1662 start_codon:yes stop_codon:yes gene_type:complete